MAGYVFQNFTMNTMSVFDVSKQLACRMFYRFYCVGGGWYWRRVFYLSVCTVLGVSSARMKYHKHFIPFYTTSWEHLLFSQLYLTMSHVRCPNTNPTCLIVMHPVQHYFRRSVPTSRYISEHLHQYYCRLQIILDMTNKGFLMEKHICRGQIQSEMVPSSNQNICAIFVIFNSEVILETT